MLAEKSHRVNSPEKIGTLYTGLIYTYKKTVPAWSGSVCCCFSPVPDLRPVLHCAIQHPRRCTGSPQRYNTEVYKTYQNPALHPHAPNVGPYSVNLRTQWDATPPEKRCYDVFSMNGFDFERLTHMKYTLSSNRLLIKKYRPVVHDLNMNNLCINMNKAC